MSIQAGFSFSHTTDYKYIETALQGRWAPVTALERELKDFVPKTISDYADHRASELVRLRELNPSAPLNELEEIVDGQIRGLSNPGIQIYLGFADRVMAEYVTVALLAHALCESLINAVLAVGLAERKAADLFSLLERVDMREKWITGPKAINPAYIFPKSGALYGTLQHLTKQRNAFVHYKIEVEVEGQKVLEGSKLHRAPLDQHLQWARRYFSLPYDLADFARSKLSHMPGGLFTSGPIKRYAPHAEA